jgi:TrmH family RNA methyltransferase
MVTKNQIKIIVSLQQKKFRNQHNLFIAEGEKTIRELLNSDFELEQIFCTSLIFKEIDNIVLISESELKKISALSTPNNCLAVFKIPIPKKIQEKGLILALDDIRDPGNLGTIIRLCDWFGISQLICSTETVDFYNPKVVQASMGSITRVNVNYINLEQFISKTTLPVFGTFMDGENIYKTNLAQNGIIIMGNEANGISSAIEKLVTHKLAIPRFGDLQKTESLNVATATALILSEFRRNEV